MKYIKCNDFVSFTEGQLRHIKTGEPFVFNYREDLHRWNQKRYEALGEVHNLCVCMHVCISLSVAFKYMHTFNICVCIYVYMCTYIGVYVDVYVSRYICVCVRVLWILFCFSVDGIFLHTLIKF